MTLIAVVLYIVSFSTPPVFGMNDLFNAIKNDDEGKVSKLLQTPNRLQKMLFRSKIADIEELDPSSKCTPLVYAMERDNENIAEILIENGARVNYAHRGYTILYMAIDLKMAKVVKLIADNEGVDVNQIIRWEDSTTSMFTTYLHKAIKTRVPAIVKAIRDKTIDMDVVDSCDFTPLQAAIYFSAGEEIVRLILKAKPNVNARNKRLETALHLAVMTYDIVRKGRFGNIVDLLLSVKNVRIDAVDFYGCTPLLAAAGYNNIQAFRSLLAAGANVHAQDNCQRTLFHYRGSYKNEEMVSLAMSRGFNVECRDERGNTPMLFAAGCSGVKAIKIFGKYGANVNAVNFKGKGALHKAVEAAADNLHVLLEWLLFYGFDFDFAKNVKPLKWRKLSLREGSVGWSAMNTLLEAGLKLSPEEFVEILNDRWPRCSRHAYVRNEKFPKFQEFVLKVTNEHLRHYDYDAVPGLRNITKDFDEKGTFALYKISKSICDKRETLMELELRKLSILDEVTMKITEGTYLTFVPLDLSKDIVFSNNYYSWKLERFAWNLALASYYSNVSLDETIASAKDVNFSEYFSPRS